MMNGMGSMMGWMMAYWGLVALLVLVVLVLLVFWLFQQIRREARTGV